MTARDNWAQVAHNLRVLADSIDAAVEPPRTERKSVLIDYGLLMDPAIDIKALLDMVVARERSAAA